MPPKIRSGHLAAAPYSRRRFLATAAVAGSALPMGFPRWLNAAPARSGQIQNQFLRLVFEPATGLFDLFRASGEPLVLNGRAEVLTAAGWRRCTDERYSRTVEEVAPVNPGLAGPQLVARCRSREREADLELRFTLLDGVDALVVELWCENVSTKPLTIPEMRPLRVEAGARDGCVWPGTTKILTNGQMYYDPGKVKDFRPGAAETSWWNAAFYRGDEEECLLCGYLENKSSRGQLSFQAAPAGSAAGGRFSLTVRSEFQAGFELPPGAKVSSDRFVLHIGPSPYAALEWYADAIGRLHHVRLNPPVNGWCSWFSFYGDITQEEVLRAAEFAATRLKPFGFEYVQVDDGFYRAFGDWEGNAKFPRGMKWLADQIRGFGLKPGIWLAPFVIAEGTEVYRQHPEWLVRRSDGRLQQIGPGLVEGSAEAARQDPRWHALDITHPGAAEWFGNLFETAAAQWGYDFFKVDFVEWSILAAERYFNPGVTKAAVYRRAYELIRRALGPRRHLLECGPGNISVGLIDSMRIELDQPPVTWQQYYLHSASTAPAAAKRYYLHNRTWVNDADHVTLGNLTPTQAQAAATMVSLSGGNLIAGDRLTDLDPLRLEILKKAFPSLGEAARPLDLFQSDRPEVFALRVRKPFGEWLVLGMFNGDPAAAKRKRVTAAQLGFKPDRAYIAYDFWGEKFFGEVTAGLDVELPPASVLLLGIHERLNRPQVLSTDRHISQGGIELEDVAWDAAKAELRGVSLGAPGTDHHVFVHLPEKHPWSQTSALFFHDFPGYTLKVMDEQILRVRVRFDDTRRVEWRARLFE